MFRLLTTLTLALSLGACASTTPTDPIGKLSLESPITIPPGAATVRIQHGRVVAANAVQEQDAFCVFELDTVSDQPQSVAAASFDIIKVNQSVESFSGMPVVPFRTVIGDTRDDPQPSQAYFKTTFRLAPNPQKARSLACMSDQMIGGAAVMRHLTLPEMQEALGKHLTLDVRGGL